MSAVDAFVDPVLYKLKDLAGDTVVGSFYRWELRPFVIPKDYAYGINEVLKTRKRKGKTEHLVSFLGYPQSKVIWKLC